LVNADAVCQGLANANPTTVNPGVYFVWLSITGTGPAQRFFTFNGFYGLTDGQTTFANSWADLVNGFGPRNPLHLSESGVDPLIFNNQVWTGTLANGFPDPS